MRNYNMNTQKPLFIRFVVRARWRRKREVHAQKIMSKTSDENFIDIADQWFSNHNNRTKWQTQTLRFINYYYDKKINKYDPWRIRHLQDFFFSSKTVSSHNNNHIYNVKLSMRALIRCNRGNLRHTTYDDLPKIQ